MLKNAALGGWVENSLTGGYFIRPVVILYDRWLKVVFFILVISSIFLLL
jgi:hypothetical protein